MRARWIVVVFALAIAAAAEQQPADQKKAADAFMAVASVLQSPRCMNCHPAGDRPLQGDGARVHSMNVMRGGDGHGTTVMQCSNCHQTANNALMHAPPGAADWHMPPRATPMPFQGLAPSQLCARLKDPSLNGGRSAQQLDDHLGTELVRWAWQPGPGRTTPPLPYDEFRAKFREWIDNGCGCP